MAMKVLATLAATLRRAVWVIGGLALLGVAWFVAQDISSPATTARDGGSPGGWGNEVVAGIHEGIQDWSPIPLANACGLGASSCFKCHNGNRAAAPAGKAWHSDHDKVNNSCVGCHEGNSRLLKKEIAHGGLVVNPVPQPDKYCAGCHAQGDPGKLAGAYDAIKKGGQPQ